MKTLFSALFIALFAVTGLYAQVPASVESATPVIDTVNGPKMVFETKEVDYGVIEQNADPYRYFKFENTGKSPLIISYAKGSCGCTVPEYSKEPIMPGEASEIKVRYDTKRIGRFTKTVTLTTNASAQNVVLRIKGEVKPKAPVPTGAPEKEENPFK